MSKIDKRVLFTVALWTALSMLVAAWVTKPAAAELTAAEKTSVSQLRLAIQNGFDAFWYVAKAYAVGKPEDTTAVRGEVYLFLFNTLVLTSDVAQNLGFGGALWAANSHGNAALNLLVDDTAPELAQAYSYMTKAMNNLAQFDDQLAYTNPAPDTILGAPRQFNVHGEFAVTAKDLTQALQSFLAAANSFMLNEVHGDYDKVGRFTRWGVVQVNDALAASWRADTPTITQITRTVDKFSAEEAGFIDEDTLRAFYAIHKIVGFQTIGGNTETARYNVSNLQQHILCNPTNVDCSAVNMQNMWNSHAHATEAWRHLDQWMDHFIQIREPIPAPTNLAIQAEIDQDRSEMTDIDCALDVASQTQQGVSDGIVGLPDLAAIAAHLGDECQPDIDTDH